LLVRLGLVQSNNEARRLIGPKSGVTIGENREKITDPTAQVQVLDALVVRVGNRRIVRVRLV
jgi:tyrosyl-tRNA synthetase